MRNLGIGFDSSLSFTTWSRHVCGHWHLVNIHSTFEKFHKSLNVETRTSLSQSHLHSGNRILTEWGSQSYTVPTFLRLEVEVCSLGRVVWWTFWHPMPSMSGHLWYDVQCPVVPKVDSLLQKPHGFWLHSPQIWLFKSPGNPVTQELPFYKLTSTSVSWGCSFACN